MEENGFIIRKFQGKMEIIFKDLVVLKGNTVGDERVWYLHDPLATSQLPVWLLCGMKDAATTNSKDTANAKISKLIHKLENPTLIAPVGHCIFSESAGAAAQAHAQEIVVLQGKKEKWEETDKEKNTDKEDFKELKGLKERLRADAKAGKALPCWWKEETGEETQKEIERILKEIEESPARDDAELPEDQRDKKEMQEKAESKNKRVEKDSKANGDVEEWKCDESATVQEKKEEKGDDSYQLAEEV